MRMAPQQKGTKAVRDRMQEGSKPHGRDGSGGRKRKIPESRMKDAAVNSDNCLGLY
jgi:hypothetical protein